MTCSKYKLSIAPNYALIPRLTLTQENLNIIRKIVLNIIRKYKNIHNKKTPVSELMFERLLNPPEIAKFLL